MSYFSEDSDLVQKINLWFDDLWDKAEISPEIDEMNSLIRDLDSRPRLEKRKQVNISSNFGQNNKPQKNSPTQDILNKIDEESATPEEKLKYILNKFERQYTENFLNRAAELVKYLDLDEADLRFKMTAPINSQTLLPAIIGNRYVLLGKKKTQRLHLLCQMISRMKFQILIELKYRMLGILLITLKKLQRMLNFQT